MSGSGLLKYLGVLGSTPQAYIKIEALVSNDGSCEAAISAQTLCVEAFSVTVTRLHQERHH